MTTASYTIGFLNGTEVMATQEGSATLSPNFVVHDVLFVPQLKFK